MRRPSTSHLGPLAVVASTLVPAVGVLALGWPTAALLGVFVLELVAVLLWSAVKIPFARKRPNNAISEDERLLSPLEDKRGTTMLPGPLPPIYVRNVPTLLVTVFLLAPFELFVAVGMLGLVDPTMTDETLATILLGGVGVFVGRGVEAYADYFRDGGYREHSPRSVMLVPFKHFFGVGALFVLAGTLRGGFDGDAVLGVVLLGKLAYDLRTLQVEHDETKRGIFYRLYGGEETEIDPVPVTVPAGEPTRRIRVPRRVAVADALYRGVRYTFTSGVLFWYAIAAFAFAFSAPLSIVAVPLVAVLAFAVVRTTTRYIRYGALEYHCYGDEDVLVAYDAVLDEPQARLERPSITDIAVTEDAVDRVFGTRTLAFDTNEQDRRPSFQLTVPDPEEIEDDDANANHPLTLPHIDDPAAISAAIGAAWYLER